MYGHGKHIKFLQKLTGLSKHKKDMKAAGYVQLGKGGEGVVYAGCGSYQASAIKVCHKIEQDDVASQMSVWPCLHDATYVKAPTAATWKIKTSKTGCSSGSPAISGTLILLMDRIVPSKMSLPDGNINFVWASGWLCSQQQWRYIRLYTAALVCSLSQLHAKRIIFHDLKPSNVMVDGAGLPVIYDTGMCVQLPEGCESLQGPGMGSLGYMAPEVMEDGQYGLAADVWSLGATIAHLCHWIVSSGTLGFDEDALAATGLWYNPSLLLKQMHQETGIPSKLRSLILDSCMVMDPSQRPAANQLMHHPYFEGMDWALVEAGSLFEADIS